MTDFSHLTEIERRAMDHQRSAETYSIIARVDRFLGNNNGAIVAQAWSAYYAYKARRLMNVEAL